jgi:hypothetical protein
MPVIVVIRLRLKDLALVNEFFTHAVATIEQAQKSEGNLGADALAASAHVWTITATRRRSSTGSRTARSCRAGRQAGATWLPMALAELTDPSPTNQTRAFPPPVQSRPHNPIAARSPPGYPPPRLGATADLAPAGTTALSRQCRPAAAGSGPGTASPGPALSL